MPRPYVVAVGLTLVFASQVSAHGHIRGIIADGKYFQGYDPSMQYQPTQPDLVAWSTPKDQDNGFIASSKYTSDDIICHVAATPGALTAPVKAGGTVELQWTDWPESHKGPVINHLANCNGECSDVDKTTLQWTKISEEGLIDGSKQPGRWGSDTLLENNKTGVVNIPESIAPGKYVLRHDIIALHEAGREGGAQSYPMCVNIEVTGSGSNSLMTGTVGTKLFSATEPGILINIYTTLDSYQIPGGKLYTG